jgi:hypothetical protein
MPKKPARIVEKVSALRAKLILIRIYSCSGVGLTKIPGLPTVRSLLEPLTKPAA